MRKPKFTIKRIEAYQVIDWEGFPCAPEPDMVRYDACYTSEKYPTIVIYFNGSEPTVARWRTFWEKPLHLGSVMTIYARDWFTYFRPPREYGLEKQSLLEKGQDRFTGVMEIEIKTKHWTDEDIEDLLKRKGGEEE